ncbi:hypothetical protein OIT44_06450 [Weissella ceti]|uniref:Uncharacterized protein n=1 Tax=Weissella ceti TaxID=759620 RepID=A0ABT3E5L5_9LACO|nr:hypothetical protein [Weissella ceti]MCW0953697.1 hypothetical protein [Weissella ceti]QVK12143.1 hypothetical protein KHQ31_00270 [Weissella ceti]
MSQSLTQTLAEFIPVENIPDAITKLKGHLDYLNETDTALRFTHIQEKFSEILAMPLNEVDSQHILSVLVEDGYDDIFARLLNLTSPDDLRDFLTDIAPNDDAADIQDQFLTFIETHRDLDTDSLLSEIYAFTPTLFNDAISSDQIDVMLYLATFISDEYATLIEPLIETQMAPPTLEEELATFLPTKDIEQALNTITDYLAEKIAAKDPIRVPHVYGDFLSIVSPEITHEQTKRILMIASMNEEYSEPFSELLLFAEDDLTEFIKVLVEPEEVENSQAAFLAYLEKQKDVDSDTFMDNVYGDVKELFDFSITDDDVDALLYYAMFVSDEYRMLLDNLLSY